jgi:hypothetical protein
MNQNGIFIMNNNAAVKDNTATSSVKVHGGGVHVSGDLTMNDNAAVKGDHATTTGSVSGENGLGNAEGGGVAVSGTFTMNGSATVAGNTATSNSNFAEGGGVEVNGYGVFTLSGGMVYGDSYHEADASLANTVTAVSGYIRGAAVYNNSNATVIINGIPITLPENVGTNDTVSAP